MLDKVIKVPASTSNLGVGFDSIGVALDLFLSVEILETCEHWEVEQNIDPNIPNDENNLIVKTALQLNPTLQPHKLKVTSNIPLSRGLGSSSSALVAGIELACRLSNRQISTLEKIKFGTQIEGHPDNIVPTIIRSGAICTILNDEVIYQEFIMPKDVAFITIIPALKISTEMSRAVLPDNLSFQQAVTQSSKANVLVAALNNGDVVTAGKMIENDSFHEPYRTDAIPFFAKLKNLGHELNGVYATYLSGSGSTIIMLAQSDLANNIIETLKTALENDNIEAILSLKSL